MGLDMYAYVAARANQQRQFYESAEFDSESRDYVSKTVPQPRELAYWRKHPNLHGWMEKLWIEKGYPGLPPGANNFDHTFNGIELELTWEDLDRLEYVIKNCELPGTTGFFFGDSADEYYQAQDLEFVKNARAELFLGLRVFYNSSW